MCLSLSDFLLTSVETFSGARQLFGYGCFHTASRVLLHNHSVIDQARNALDHIARVVCVSANDNKEKRDENCRKAKHHMERLYLDSLKVWHHRRLESHWQDRFECPLSIDNFQQYIQYEKAYCRAKHEETGKDCHQHRIECYSFGGINAFKGDEIIEIDTRRLESPDTEKLIRYYWAKLKPLIADYEVKTRLYFMDAARSCVVFWEFLCGVQRVTSDTVAESFGSSCWKILLFLIHYEYTVSLGYKKFGNVRLCNKGVGKDDWIFAEGLYQILGAENTNYKEPPEITVDN